MSIFGEIAKGNVEVSSMLGLAISPFTGFFSNIKNIVIAVVIGIIVLTIGYMVYNYNDVMKKNHNQAVTTAVEAAANNAIDTKTVQESAKTAADIVADNQEAKAVVVKEEKKITDQKKVKIEKINKTTDRVVSQPGITVEEKAAAEAKRDKEISTVQINAIWDSYCDTVNDLEKPTLDQKLSCVI